MKCQMSMGREFGMTILLFLLPLMVVLGSCSTYNAINVMEKLDKTFRAYGNIIRWEKFETASLFAASSIHDEFEKRVKDAKNVVVVDYRIINVEYGEGGKKVTVNAEISYHTLSSNLVRTLIDKQIWVYGEEKGSKQWRLLTLLPEFK
jgi:hypothetical protein